MDTTPAGTPRIGGLSPDAFSSLFQAIGGLRNRSALIAMFASLVTGIVLMALLSTLGGFASMLGGLLYMLALWTGINAAGVLLMDQAKGIPPRSLIDALVYGLICIPKVLVLGIVFFAVALIVFLAIALIYFVCKIPVLGPLLYTVVLPLSVVIGGVTIWGLFVCSFLSLPAIWQGAGIMSAVAQSLAIVRTRLIETLLLMTFIWILSFIVGLIVFGVLGMGMLPSISLSAMVFGGGGGGFGGGGFGGLMGGAMQGLGGAGGHAIAGLIGMMVLFAAAGTLVAQVYLLGLNLVYLRVTEGLDSSATQQALQQRLDEAKRRAADMGQKARDAAERARERSAQPPPAPAPTASAPTVAAMEATTPTVRTPAPAVALTCPACHASVTAEDVFCESCGHRLK